MLKRPLEGQYLLSPRLLNVVFFFLCVCVCVCVVILVFLFVILQHGRKERPITSLGVSVPFSSVALCVHGIAERVWQLQRRENG